MPESTGEGNGAECRQILLCQPIFQFRVAIIWHPLEREISRICSGFISFDILLDSLISSRLFYVFEVFYLSLRYRLLFHSFLGNCCRQAGHSNRNKENEKIAHTREFLDRCSFRSQLVAG